MLAKLEKLQCSEVQLPEQSPSGDGGRAAVRVTNTTPFRLELHPLFLHLARFSRCACVANVNRILW